MKKLDDTREKRAKLNIVVSLSCQFPALLCGLIVPHIMIGRFGSEVYGATASIAQFLAYIALLEGGIGGVARAALYKPLAENNIKIISDIVGEIELFFRKIAYIFAIYAFVLACGFQIISHLKCFDWFNTFLLVVVISISTFAEYFIGISYTVLIQADQRTYITNIINTSTSVLNTIMILIFINFGCSVIIVKLVSSCVFVLRPVLMWLYVRKTYHLIKKREKKQGYLNQKWAGLGQHIAYFLYSNTDIAVLTLFVDLKTVAVYSVYHMVVSKIESFTASFSTGMEALFGNMLANREIEMLHKTFEYYETLISMIAAVLFSTTEVLIVPFVRLYTARVADAEYIVPGFSTILILATVVSCLRRPYHDIIIAAGHFRETQVAAYGEAVINIVLSILLVIRFGLIGVAVGTLAAATFRLLYYVVYLSKNIFYRSMSLFFRRALVNGGIFLSICCIGSFISVIWNFSGYFMWACCGVLVTLAATAVTIAGNYIFYKEDLQKILARGKR